MAATDPRAPVVVGAAQVSRRPFQPSEAVHPLDLMVESARAAAADSGVPGVLARIASVRVVESLGWRSPNPGALVGSRLGIEPADFVVTATGGNGPLSLLHDTCAAIAAGDLDSALLVGAEAFYSRRVASKAEVRIPDPAEKAGGPARVIGDPASGSHPLEMEAGLNLPAQIYPLFSTALAAANAESPDEHRRACGRLWAQFSEVAAANPYAWSDEAMSPGQVGDPSPDNRMVAFPYTKRLCANIQVDQAAAVIVMSAAAAEAAGVASERWVFPWAGAEAQDGWFVSERADLRSSPALAACRESLRARLGWEPGQAGHVDVYSCFPSAVMVAARALGLELDGRLTLTGGLTFAGGPGNNYSMHSLATAVERLRRDGGTALVTGVGWYLTKHAVTVLGSGPPASRFSAEHLGERAGRTKREVILGPAPGAEQEAFTVLFGRDGEINAAVVSALSPDGSRRLMTTPDAGVAAALMSGEEVDLGDGAFA